MVPSRRNKRPFDWVLPITGRSLWDDFISTSVQVTDTATARHEAILAAREILAEAIKDGKPNVADAFVIMDEAGRTVDIVPLAAVLPEHMKK